MDKVFRQPQWKKARVILNREPTGKRLLGEPRRRWEDNIRIDLGETSVFTKNQIDLA